MRQTITNENGETIVRIDSSDRGPLTEEELDMISRMENIVDEYDEECPPMPEEMMIQMRNDIESRRTNRIASNAHRKMNLKYQFFFNFPLDFFRDSW